LQTLFREVIKYHDHTIICGHRGKTDQDAAYKSGASEKPWPKSKHNKAVSEAVDAAPWIRDSISYNPIECAVFAGIVFETARRLGVQDLIIWGGDWDGDGDVMEHKLKDLVHFEVKA
jgi:peptidoglycan L-alanyl-D-glutamate endopeptidase CwlK